MALRHSILIVTMLVVGVACGSSPDAAPPGGPDATDATEATDATIPTDTLPVPPTSDIDSGVDCSQEALSGGDDEFRFTTAHEVVGATLGPTCVGEVDPIVVDAWASLAAITPVGQLSELLVFGGFEPEGPEAEETLAFVNTIDSDGTAFQMSINTVEAAADPDELLLTLAHEFSHVFTATVDQIDRTDEAFDLCETYFNGEGCYRADSLMMAWIDEFWSADVLAGIDPDNESADEADERCAADDGFFGPYAATNPEEDFAEAFSAFVFEVEPDTLGQASRLDWIAAQPGLAEFRTRADAAGLTPLANRFDPCGS